MPVFSRFGIRCNHVIKLSRVGIKIYAILLFIFAGFAEISEGYLIWLWLREGTPFYLGAFGEIVLAFLYGIITTFQTFPSFGRVYAAYGGVFIVLSVLWGWGIDKRTPFFSPVSK